MSSSRTTPEHPEHTPSSQAVFGMKRAAEVAGVSVSTIRRNKERLRDCGAEISPHGWEVPMSALVASGLMRKQTPPEDTPVKDLRSSQTAVQDLERMRELERDLLELRHRAELAEERQRSAEQQAQAAKELADALMETLQVERRMLTSNTAAARLKDESSSVQPDPLPNELEASRSPSWLKRVLNLLSRGDS